jgi:hypothetical protein
MKGKRFMQDGVPAHTANYTKRVLEKIDVLECPTMYWGSLNLMMKVTLNFDVE